MKLSFMGGCGLISFVLDCFNVKTHGIWEVKECDNREEQLN